MGFLSVRICFLDSFSTSTSSASELEFSMISFAEGRGDEERERKKGGDEQGNIARGVVNDSR